MAKNIEIPDGWEVKKLGEVCTLEYGQSLTEKNRISGNIPIYSSAGIVGYHNTALVSGPCIVVGRKGSAGSVFLSINDLFCIDTAYYIKTKINVYFLYYVLLRLKLDKIKNNGNVPGLNRNDVYIQSILLPPLDEQKKIADILSLWDKAIQQTKELIAYKETQKKGLMQNLLTGKKRLHGFNDDWKTIKLGEVAEITTGNKNNEDKIENGLYPFFVRSKNIEKINTYSFDGEAILVPGDGNIGDIYHYINGKFDFHQRVYKISNFKLIYGKFLYYNMQVFFKKRAISQTSKATVNSLRMNTFTQYKIFMPVNIDEQKAIADILSKADEEINLLHKQLDLYTEQKKGLMQNLLTGKIRV